MNIERPLHFFEQYIPNLVSEKNISFAIQLTSIPFDVEQINYKKGTVTLLEPIYDEATRNIVSEKTVIYPIYEFAITHVFRAELIDAQESIREFISKNSRETNEMYVLTQFGIIEYCIFHLNKVPNTEVLIGKIKGYLIGFKEELYFKFKYILPNDFVFRKEDVRKNITFKPIKWLAGPAVLATLIHDIWQLRSAKGQLYMETNLSDLTEFVFNSFVDADGLELSKPSLRTYLDPSRPDKKSKREKIEVYIES